MRKVANNFGRMGIPMSAEGTKMYLQKRAKFAPQMIADGFTDAITSQQGNLMKGAFDLPDDNTVDPYSNINSDKFAMMNADIQAMSVDPSPDPTDE